MNNEPSTYSIIYYRIGNYKYKREFNKFCNVSLGIPTELFNKINSVVLLISMSLRLQKKGYRKFVWKINGCKFLGFTQRVQDLTYVHVKSWTHRITYSNMQN